MKIAVTGASGHVGNVLCRSLVEQGSSVKALVHRNEDDLKEIGTEIVKGDILDPSSLNNLCRDAEIVFHLAAKISIDHRKNDEVMRINVDGTKNIINACLQTGVKKLVHFSSIHVLDPFPLKEELNEKRGYNLHTKMSYELSKMKGEILVQEAVAKGLDAVIIMPTAIIGPWDFQPSLLGKAMIKMYRNALPMLLPGGYNWVDVRDVVQGAVIASDRGRTGERYILSGHWLNLVDLSAMIGRLTGKKTTSFVGPPFIAKFGQPFIAAWARMKNEDPLYTKDSLDILKHSNSKISYAKARDELGYASRPIDETIRDTFLWYRQNGLIS